MGSTQAQSEGLSIVSIAVEYLKKTTVLSVRRSVEMKHGKANGFDKPVTIALLNGWGDTAKLMIVDTA